MTAYQLALLVHLLALLAATATSAIVHFAAARRASAPTLRQALEWARLAGSAARVFPIAVVTLVASGSYMVAVAGQWSWGAGWVDAGIVGALTLFVSGAVLGKRGAAAGRAGAERLQRAGHDVPNDAAPDRLAAALSNANTGLALGVVFAMTMKPGLVGSLTALAVGAAAGAYLGLSHARAHAASARDVARAA